RSADPPRYVPARAVGIDRILEHRAVCREVAVIAVAHGPPVGADSPGQEDRPDRIVVLDEQPEVAVLPAGEAAAVGGAGRGVETVLGEVAFRAAEVRTDAQQVGVADRRTDLDLAAEAGGRRVAL